MMSLTCEMILSLVSELAVTKCRAPILYPYRPMFLAKDCETIIWNPKLMKYLIAQASFSRSPLANPWQAESKQGKREFLSITSAIFFHSSWVGSTPVGLWAHACSRTIEPAGAFQREDTIPLMSTERVLGSQYVYSANQSLALARMFLWLGQVGLEMQTVLGQCMARNSNPTLNEPVPERLWTLPILPSFRAGQFYPKMSFWAPETKDARPSIGRYSLSNFLSATISASTFLTTSKTQGLPELSLQAPMPKLILLGSLSFLQAMAVPRTTSGGDMGTFSKMLGVLSLEIPVPSSSSLCMDDVNLIYGWHQHLNGPGFGWQQGVLMFGS